MSPAGNDPAIVIIGSGFTGLCLAIALKRAGYHDFVVLEKNDDLCGTWRDNKYPGCACDVPSHMYSFSFELNPGWSRMFAPQHEIWEYTRHCARKYGVTACIRFGCSVEGMEWDEAIGRWRVATTAGETYTAHMVVFGMGALHMPSIPEIPGAGQFGGAAFHSAHWDQSCSLSGKRVAVIGTGASAIQFIPEIARQAAHVDVFQRTPPWIHPRPDFEIPPAVRAAFAAAPPVMRTFRYGSALRRFNDRIQRRLGRAVWSQGGCTSWYLDADGVNRTLWPGFSFEYWVRTRRARRADYVIR